MFLCPEGLLLKVLYNFPGSHLHLYMKIPFSDTHLILDAMQQTEL